MMSVLPGGGGGGWRMELILTIEKKSGLAFFCSLVNEINNEQIYRNTTAADSS
jgi:hypothetical protein